MEIIFLRGSIFFPLGCWVNEGANFGQPFSFQTSKCLHTQKCMRRTAHHILIFSRCNVLYYWLIYYLVMLVYSLCLQLVFSPDKPQNFLVSVGGCRQEMFTTAFLLIGFKVLLGINKKCIQSIRPSERQLLVTLNLANSQSEAYEGINIRWKSRSVGFISQFPYAYPCAHLGALKCSSQLFLRSMI